MISRTWHGVVPKEKGKAFLDYLKITGVKESRAIKGNMAAYVTSMDQGEYTHVFLCTLWSSRDAITAFAGKEPQIAVTYPEDAQYGLISDPIVIHQEVSSDKNPFER